MFLIILVSCDTITYRSLVLENRTDITLNCIITGVDYEESGEIQTKTIALAPGEIQTVYSALGMGSQGYKPSDFYKYIIQRLHIYTLDNEHLISAEELPDEFWMDNTESAPRGHSSEYKLIITESLIETLTRWPSQ